jgi:plastocyanin
MRTFTVARVTAGLVLFGLSGAFAACGGGGDDSTTADGTQKPSGNPSIPAGSPYIDQDNLAFKPSKLTVKVGDKVYFDNSESALHTVTINGKNESGTMKKGAIYVFTAPAAGTYKITCDFHAQMNATLTVE